MAGRPILSARISARGSPWQKRSRPHSTVSAYSCWPSSSRRACLPRRRPSDPPPRATTSPSPQSPVPRPPMELYPAVDLEDGRVVRAHGDMAEPLRALAELTRGGARWIHLVDMDRAYGRGDNHALMQAVMNAATVRVQVGGGLF